MDLPELMKTANKTISKRRRVAPSRRVARKVCLLCGHALPATRAARLAHLVEYHAGEESEMILDQYDSMLAGVPQMESVIERAAEAAAEVLELERMFSLPSGRRAK